MGEVIINKAKELFFTYGLKSISMDDLAKKVGMSKKTIYQTIADKNELVSKVVDQLIQCHEEAITQSGISANDAIEEIMYRICLPFATLAAVNINFFYELERFFPAEWKKLIAYRQQKILPSIVQNVKRGITEGLYNEDSNIELVAAIRLQQITTALNPIDFQVKKQDPQTLMYDLTLFYLHSITTTKGKRLLNKYSSRYNESKIN